jgi:hypothetical protein
MIKMEKRKAQISVNSVHLYKKDIIKCHNSNSVNENVVNIVYSDLFLFHVLAGEETERKRLECCRLLEKVQEENLFKNNGTPICCNGEIEVL